MKKLTLLEMTQNILSAMTSDEVNSISDTVESVQVAEIIKETYYEQFTGLGVQEFKSLVKIDGIDTLTAPNYLLLPDSLLKLEWIRYKDVKHQNRMKELSYLDPEIFFNSQFLYTSTGANLALVTDPTSLVQYYIKNNSAPTWYTILNQKYIVTDSYDVAHEDTLHGANTIAYGLIGPVFSMVDTFVPALEAKKFPQLLAEAKSVCFLNLKQTPNPKEEQRAKRQRVHAQADRNRESNYYKERYFRLFDFARHR